MNTAAKQFDTLQFRTFGISLIVAPLLILISSLFHAMDRTVWSGSIQVYAFLFYVPACLALTTLLAARTPRWAMASRMLLTLGCLGGACWAATRALIGAAEGTLDAAVITELYAIEDTGLPFALNLPGVAFPLTMVAVGITLWRTGAVSALHGIGIALAAIAFPMSRIPNVPELFFISDVLFLLTLGAIGLRFLSSGAAITAQDGAATVVARA